MDNHQLLEELAQYVPPGYLEGCTHFPMRGCGERYWDVRGNAYLDWSSGIFTNTFGHDGFSMPAVSLSNIHGRHALVELEFLKMLFVHLPAADYKAVVYGDGGGYTMDRGLTVLHQYFGKRRVRIAAFAGGFHGKTQATKLLINRTEHAAFFHNCQIPFPNCYRCPWGETQGNCAGRCIAETCNFLEEEHIDVLVFEPVQGSGIIPPPAGYWRELGQFCRERGILLFADEVLTGGGRTGQYLASTAFGIVPDLLVLTKGLANGLPLSVLLMRDFLVQNPYSTRYLEYSSTFLAVPFLLEAGCQVLEAMEDQDILYRVQRLGPVLGEGLLRLKERFPCIGDVRWVGLMAAVEFVRDRETKEPDPAMGTAVFSQCEAQGLELIPGGHILRMAPALNTTRENLARGLWLLEAGIRAAMEGSG